MDKETVDYPSGLPVISKCQFYRYLGLKSAFRNLCRCLEQTYYFISGCMQILVPSIPSWQFNVFPGNVWNIKSYFHPTVTQAVSGL